MYINNTVLAHTCKKGSEGRLTHLTSQQKLLWPEAVTEHMFQACNFIVQESSVKDITTNSKRIQTCLLVIDRINVIICVT